MLKYLFCALLLAQTVHAAVNEGPWLATEELAGVWSIEADFKTVKHYVLFKSQERAAWPEVDAILKKKYNDPNVMHSPEYSVYRFGATAIIYPAFYFMQFDSNPDSPAYYINSKGEHLTLPTEYSKEKPFVNLIQPSRSNVDCLLLGADGSGCGDLFQGGVTNDELACYRNKTYFKCHLECTVPDRSQYTNGRCAR